MPRYLTSAIFTDVAVTMSTFIASRREPWYEASSSIVIDSAHRANQVRRWSRRSSYRDRHELILCVRRLFPSRPVMEPSRTLAGVINTTHPGRDRMASRMLSSGCLRQLESDGRRPERRVCSLQACGRSVSTPWPHPRARSPSRAGLGVRVNETAIIHMECGKPLTV